MIKTKAFYNDLYETGQEIEEQYQAWAEQFGSDFRLVKKSWRRGWLFVRYEIKKSTAK